jgi:hypothetical protein
MRSNVQKSFDGSVKSINSHAAHFSLVTVIYTTTVSGKISGWASNWASPARHTVQRDLVDPERADDGS